MQVPEEGLAGDIGGEEKPAKEDGDASRDDPDEEGARKLLTPRLVSANEIADLLLHHPCRVVYRWREIPHQVGFAFLTTPGYDTSNPSRYACKERCASASWVRRR
jgi:hypothetical protein